MLKAQTTTSPPHEGEPTGPFWCTKETGLDQDHKNTAMGYTTVYSSRLRSDTIDNNRLHPVSNETQSRLDLSCDAVAVELVYKETVAHFQILLNALWYDQDNQVFLTSFLQCFWCLIPSSYDSQDLRLNLSQNRAPFLNLSQNCAHCSGHSIPCFSAQSIMVLMMICSWILHGMLVREIGQ